MSKTIALCLTFFLTATAIALPSVQTTQSCNKPENTYYTIQSKDPNRDSSKIYILEKKGLNSASRFYQVQYCEQEAEACRILGRPDRMYSGEELVRINRSGAELGIKSMLGATSGLGIAYGVGMLVAAAIPTGYAGMVIGTVAVVGSIAGSYVAADKLVDKAVAYFAVIPEGVAASDNCSTLRSVIYVNEVAPVAEQLNKVLMKL